MSAVDDAAMVLAETANEWDHECGGSLFVALAEALAAAGLLRDGDTRPATHVFRKGFCCLCTHPVTDVACSSCGCLAHYPPWPPAGQAVPCHVAGCVDHIDGMHTDAAGDAVVHIGCPLCAGPKWKPVES